MCLLAVASTRKLTKEEFTNGFNRNSDGFGMGWIKKGKVHYVKGIMKLDEAWATYDKLNILPHAVHFRMTSTGTTVPSLTHPFIVNEGSNPLVYTGESPVLFQNGTLSGWRDLYLTLIINGAKMQGPISDTFVMAQVVGRALKADADMDTILHDGGKWAIIDTKQISTFGKFIDEKGVLFSNSGYETVKYTSYQHYAPLAYEIGDIVSYSAVYRGAVKTGEIIGTIGSTYTIKSNAPGSDWVDRGVGSWLIQKLVTPAKKESKGKGKEISITDLVNEENYLWDTWEAEKDKDSLTEYEELMSDIYDIIEPKKGSMFVADEYDYVYSVSESGVWELIGVVENYAEDFDEEYNTVKMLSDCAFGDGGSIRSGETVLVKNLSRTFDCL